MNRKTLIALAAFAAAVTATGVRADEADASQYVHQFEGNRTRAEVQAEASRVSATRSIEPAGSRVAAASTRPCSATPSAPRPPRPCVPA